MPRLCTYDHQPCPPGKNPPAHDKTISRCEQNGICQRVNLFGTSGTDRYAKEKDMVAIAFTTLCAKYGLDLVISELQRLIDEQAASRQRYDIPEFLRRNKHNQD